MAGPFVSFGLRRVTRLGRSPSRPGDPVGCQNSARVPEKCGFAGGTRFLAPDRDRVNAPPHECMNPTVAISNQREAWLCVLQDDRAGLRRRLADDRADQQSPDHLHQPSTLSDDRPEEGGGITRAPMLRSFTKRARARRPARSGRGARTSAAVRAARARRAWRPAGGGSRESRFPSAASRD